MFNELINHSVPSYEYLCHIALIRSGSIYLLNKAVDCFSSLAHLWGAYAIPVVHHVPGLCLLGIGGAPYISHKIMAQKPNVHIFYFFSETTSRWCFIIC